MAISAASGATQPPPTRASFGEVAAGMGIIGAASAIGPSIVPRSPTGIAATTLAGAGLGAVAGITGEIAARTLDATTGLDRMQSHLVVGAAGLATAAISHRLPGGAAAGAASVGATLAVTGGLGAALDLAHKRFDADGDGRFGPDIPNGVIAAGAGAIAAIAAAKFGPAAYTAWKNTARIATGGAEATAAGKAAGELIDRAKITVGGRLFMQNRVEGLPIEPVRAYMPFELDGLDLKARAALTVESMVNQGAFERSKIVIASPTGTGGINPSPVIMDEILSGGDTAWVVAQYGDKPSVQSLHKTPAAVEAFMEITRQVANKRQELFPNGDGPPLYATATSLGARNIHAALLKHSDELFGPHINLQKASLIGAPEHLTTFTPGSLPGGMVGRFRSSEEMAAVTPEAAEKMKVIEYAHFDDPVRLMDFKMLYQRPAFLTAEGAVPGVEHKRPFVPGGTLLRHAFDVTAAIVNGTDSTIDDIGHDYRGDMAEAVALGFGHRGATKDALEGASLRAQELSIADSQRIKRVLTGKE